MIRLLKRLEIGLKGFVLIHYKEGLYGWTPIKKSLILQFIPKLFSKTLKSRLFADHWSDFKLYARHFIYISDLLN